MPLSTATLRGTESLQITGRRRKDEAEISWGILHISTGFSKAFRLGTRGVSEGIFGRILKASIFGRRFVPRALIPTYFLSQALIFQQPTSKTLIFAVLTLGK